MKKIKKTRKNGFTLLELVVVIAIIGILSAIAVLNFAGTTSSARIAADVATFDAVNISILMLAFGLRPHKSCVRLN